jgi:hypothetical protein
MVPACNSNGVDLKYYLEKFPEVCQQKFGRTYDYSFLERRFLPLRDGQRSLSAGDVSYIFHPNNTPFARYWAHPNKGDLEKLLKAHPVDLRLKPAGREQLVRSLLAILQSVGVASIVLRFTHPEEFGVFNTPVLNMTQVNRPETIVLYLAYCDELKDWGGHFGISTVAQTELAVWTLAEIIRDAATSKDSAAAAVQFDSDVWIQRRRAAQVLRPFLKRYGQLQLARIFLDEDHRLAGKIAADEYERLLCVASLQVYGRRLNLKYATELIDEMERKGKISLREQEELQHIWETRNAAVHPNRRPPTRAEVEVMIDRIQDICAAWEVKPKQPAKS